MCQNGTSNSILLFSASLNEVSCYLCDGMLITQYISVTMMGYGVNDIQKPHKSLSTPKLCLKTVKQFLIRVETSSVSSLVH